MHGWLIKSTFQSEGEADRRFLTSILPQKRGADAPLLTLTWEHALLPTAGLAAALAPWAAVVPGAELAALGVIVLDQSRTGARLPCDGEREKEGKREKWITKPLIGAGKEGISTPRSCEN